MVDINEIKKLRDSTGLSIGKCKEALEEVNGDMDKAKDLLREKGKLTAQTKQERELGAGCVQSYIHHTNMSGAMIELLCETDFVSKNEEFVELAKNIAVHVAGMKPLYVSRDMVNEATINSLKEELRDEVDSSKPQEMQAKILEGKLDSKLKEDILLEQLYIKDSDMTIKNLIDSYIQKFGEKIEVGHIVVFDI